MVRSDMDSKSRFNKPSTFDKTFYVFRWFFTYTYPIFYQGVKKNGLQFEDIPRCSKYDEAEKNMENLKIFWSKEKVKEKPRLWWVLVKTYYRSFFIPLLFYIFEECFLRIVQSLLLGRVIRHFTDESIGFKEACWCAAGVTICMAIFIMTHHTMMLVLMRIGLRIRVACCSLIYEKTLRLSRLAVGETAIGQIVNIMSNDVNRMDEFTIFVLYLFVAPIQTALIVYIIYGYIGWCCFIGIALLFLFIPFQGFMGKLFSGIRRKTAFLTDTRLRFMNEIISGMRVIKMYSWEKPFADRVADARSSEVSKIRHSCFLKALNLSIYFVCTRIISFVCFVCYVLFVGQLTAEAVFVTMALLNTTRLTMTFFFPQAISMGSEMSVTCKRIERLLLLDEKKVDETKSNNESKNDETMLMSTPKKSNLLESNLKSVSVDSLHPLTSPSPKQSPLASKRNLTPPPLSRLSSFTSNKVLVNNISAKWIANSSNFTLKDVSVRLKPGDLLIVIGPVGSGKSSFLMTLLQELSLINGEIDIQGSLSYASQDSWSFNESVRNNILFGMPYDEQRYKDVIRVCALERDLTLMPFGDKTLVGEKGVSLSGGQKARINLARAVYRNSDIILLDDPLSAVDTAVAEHIFEKCIMEYLSKDKIRVLVTHQTQFIQKATKILVLKDGFSLACGTFQELQKQGIDFMSLVNKKEQNTSTPDNESREQRERSYSRLSIESSTSNSVSKSLLTRTMSFGQEKFETSSESIDEKSDLENFEEPLQIQDEQFQRGSIGFKTYKEYVKSGSSWFLFIMVIVFTLLSQVLFNGSDLFLTSWTNKNQAGSDVDEANKHRDIIIYTALVLGLFLSTIIRSISFFEICMKASKNLHNTIFERMLHSPVSFFDTNPVGRILNRFTKDLGIVDEMLPNTAFDLNLTLFQVFGVVVNVCIVSWYLALPAFFLTGLVIYVRGVYIKSCRDIKRFEGLARSPVYSHVSTTINGLVSIRAFGAQNSFRNQFFIYQDDHTATWFIFISASRALGLLMDWICTVYVGIISVVVMLAKDMPGGNAGLAISSGLMLAGMAQWGVRQSTEFESQMTSVERIIEYKHLEKEAAMESDPEKKPPTEWPESGQIKFIEMFLAYINSEKPVLKNLNLSIEGSEKIGIVGRTGAGKTSIISALFRLTEPTGSIEIDRIDIKSIGLHDLRKKISIIPQDPVVFSGSVRYNLDPFNEYPDQDLWEALEEVQLKSQVNSYEKKLEENLTESGGNLSVGQRQLICLARAVLRKNKILILDEATANVDHQTDSLIQQTIRSKFASCTVLTIAHRLNTIIDCDRVLVLDAGQIVEFDKPYHLLKARKNFYDMCMKTGSTMYSHLHKMAKATYHHKKQSE